MSTVILFPERFYVLYGSAKILTRIDQRTIVERLELGGDMFGVMGVVEKGDRRRKLEDGGCYRWLIGPAE